jgi:hypothetical protein
MKNCFFVHHLGLGDELVLCGLVKTLLMRYNNVYLPVKKHNIQNVNKLYEQDFPFLKILPVEDDLDMINLSKKFESIADIIFNGIFGKELIKKDEKFCEWFYRTENVEYENRWNLFTFSEDLEKQQKKNLENKYNNFIFVHDDPSRNFIISEKYLIGKNIYKPQHSLGTTDQFTIFDYKKILLEAEEIHCMDSSFAILIDQIPELKNKLKFIHRYIRQEGGPIYKNNWRILE